MKYIIYLVMILFNLAVTETLFEVKDASNHSVLDVSTDGIRIMNYPDTLMVISTSGIKAYVLQDSTKGLSRTFSVTTPSSVKGDNKVFEIASEAGATFYNPSNSSDKIFSVSKGGIIANVNPAEGRDYLVNSSTAGKLDNNLMKVSFKDAFEAINDSTMLYYKKKNAFRVGYVKIDADSEVGQASFATGYQNKASGPCASALGIKTESTGYGSTSMGTLTKAQAISSTAMGSQTIASGYNSTSMGYQSQASGNNSTAAGWLTTAQSMNEFVVGNLNSDWGSPNTWSDSDPLFVVGNGLILGPDLYDRRNAVTVLKNGYTSIGNIIPNSRLDVAGDVRINDNSLYLRGPNDTNHGLKYREYWNSTYVNGPTLFGYEGGALGTSNGAISLTWNEYGAVTIPQGNFIVSTGGLRVSTGLVYVPILYSTSGTGGKYVRVDSTGKLYSTTSKDEADYPGSEEIEILKNENIKLRSDIAEQNERITKLENEVKKLLK